MSITPDTPPPEGFDPAPGLPSAEIPKLSLIKRCLLWLIAIDIATLKECPVNEPGRLAGFGLLLVGSFSYQTLVMTIVAHRLWAAPGKFRPELLAGALFLAGFIMAIDSILVIQPSLFRSGEQELRAAGMPIPEGPLDLLKTGVLYAFRLAFSGSIALLLGFFVATTFFARDIDFRINGGWRHDNAFQITKAEASVDARTAQATKALQDEEQRFNTLSRQAVAMRQNQLDPLANDPLVQQAQAELARLGEQKAKDDEEVRRSERFETDERAGIQGNVQNSGHAGNGPRHRAAVAQLTYARTHAQETVRDLAAAQTRLAELRRRLSTSGVTARQDTAGQTQEFEAALAAEGKEHDRLKAELRELTEGREEAVRKLVEKAPGYVAPDNGLLNQVRLMGQLTDGDKKLQMIVLLIEFASFSLEAAGVLGKMMTSAPLTYTARVAAKVWTAVIELVDETAARLNRNRPPGDGDGLMPAFAGPDLTPPTSPAGGAAVMPPEIFGDIGEPPAPADPPKRKRGRPRKTPVH